MLIIKTYPLQVYGVCLAREQPSSKVKLLFVPSEATRLASMGNVRGGGSVLPPGAYEMDISNSPVIAISPDNQKLAECGARAIEIANTETCLVFDRLPGLAQDSDPWEAYQSYVLAICFSNDQHYIIGLTLTQRYLYGIRNSKETLFVVVY